MANALFLNELSARVDEHLHQFMDEEEEMYEPKKRSVARQVGNAALATAGAVGVSKAVDYYAKNEGAIKQGAKDAAFTGMTRTAKAANTVGNKISKYGRKATMAGERRILDGKAGGATLKKGGDLAAGAAKKLKKGSSSLRKTAMKQFFCADLAATMLRIEGKLTELGA